jgi:hypothetical protein
MLSASKVKIASIASPMNLSTCPPRARRAAVNVPKTSLRRSMTIEPGAASVIAVKPRMSAYQHGAPALRLPEIRLRRRQPSADSNGRHLSRQPSAPVSAAAWKSRHRSPPGAVRPEHGGPGAGAQEDGEGDGAASPLLGSARRSSLGARPRQPAIQSDN